MRNFAHDHFGYTPPSAGDVRASLSGYLELVRPPNITTALADVLAGYAIAGLGQPQRLAWLLVATATLYAGGIVFNDYFDRTLDAVERPERPIPSGRVPAQRAAAFGAGLLVIGILAAAMATPAAAAVAVTIAVLALTYDAAAKHHPVLGPITMGACRGLNLLLGIAAVPLALSFNWPLALLPFLYIWAVTTVSRGEVHGGARTAAAASFVALLLVLAGLVYLTVGAVFLGATSNAIAAACLVFALAWRVLPAYWRAWHSTAPGDARAAVRTGVLSLVLLDAVLSAVYAGSVYALAVLAAAFVAGWLARQFAVT